MNKYIKLLLLISIVLFLYSFIINTNIYADSDEKDKEENMLDGKFDKDGKPILEEEDLNEIIKEASTEEYNEDEVENLREYLKEIEETDENVGNDYKKLKKKYPKLKLKHLKHKRVIEWLIAHADDYPDLLSALFSYVDDNPEDSSSEYYYPYFPWRLYWLSRHNPIVKKELLKILKEHPEWKGNLFLHKARVEYILKHPGKFPYLAKTICHYAQVHPKARFAYWAKKHIARVNRLTKKKQNLLREKHRKDVLKNNKQRHKVALKNKRSNLKDKIKKPDIKKVKPPVRPRIPRRR